MNMNIDANVQKIIKALLSKLHLLIIFAIIGALAAYFYAAHFTTLTYSSSILFLTSAVDTDYEISENSTSDSSATRTSNTSKMNYAMKMLSTYIEILGTNDFNTGVATELNHTYGRSYTASQVKNSMHIETIEDTAMFKVTVTTTSADTSYEIAHQLETYIPSAIKNTNSGLVEATVEDAPLKATAAGTRGYPQKCLIGAAAGAVLAGIYVILRDFLDIRIKTSEELVELYNIPVLGAIPEFEIKIQHARRSNKS